MTTYGRILSLVFEFRDAFIGKVLGRHCGHSSLRPTGERTGSELQHVSVSEFKEL